MNTLWMQDCNSISFNSDTIFLRSPVHRCAWIWMATPSPQSSCPDIILMDSSRLWITDASLSLAINRRLVPLLMSFTNISLLINALFHSFKVWNLSWSQQLFTVLKYSISTAARYLRANIYLYRMEAALEKNGLNAEPVTCFLWLCWWL